MSEQETSGQPTETKNDAGAVGGDNGQATAANAGEQGQVQGQGGDKDSPLGESNLLTEATAKQGSDGESDPNPKENGEAPKEDGDKDEGKDKEPEGAPESYQDFAAPEGLSYDDKFIGTFKDVAKELNLSQKQAQHLLDKCAPALFERQIEQIKAVSKSWEEKTKADKEIGGANWTRAASDIARVRDMFSVNADGTKDPDIEEFMKTPIGNHPGLLKLLARVGRAFGEADFPRGSVDTSGKFTPAQFYASAKK